MEVIDLLLYKKELLVEFYKMVMKEKQCIQQEEWKRVDNIIKSKEYKISKINVIDKKLNNKNIHSIRNNEEENIYRNIREILKDIQELENENIKMIEKMIKESKDHFADIQVKQKVNKAYSRIESIQKDGCFIDKFK